MNIISQNTFITQNTKNLTVSSKNNKNFCKLNSINYDTVSFSSKKTDVADKINKLHGDPFDNANKIKEILLEDMGLPKDCIQVELLDLPENSDGYCDYLNMATGNILIHRNPKMTKQDIALVIRHELEHIRQSFGIIKHFGLDKYKEYIEANKKEIQSNFPDISTEFNVKLWSNKSLYNSVPNTKEQCLCYLKSFEERNKLELEPDSEYKYMKLEYLYFSDPGEQEAYKAQDELAAKFGVKSKAERNALSLEYFPQIENKINEIIAKNPHYKKYIAKIFQKALHQSCLNNPVDRNLSGEEILRQRYNGIIIELDRFLKIQN